MANDAALRMLQVHLPYELDMLEGTFVRLHSPEWAHLLKDDCTKNAFIEAFWSHVRNILEFLEKKHAGGATFQQVASARHFAVTYHYDSKLDSNPIHIQISHLQYERPVEPEGKLDHNEMRRVKTTIEREIERFQSLLDAPFRDAWTKRKSKVWVGVLNNNSTSTHPISVSNTIFKAHPVR